MQQSRFHSLDLSTEIITFLGAVKIHESTVGGSYFLDVLVLKCLLCSAVRNSPPWTFNVSLIFIWVLCDHSSNLKIGHIILSSHVYYQLPSLGFSHPHLYLRKTFVMECAICCYFFIFSCRLLSPSTCKEFMDMLVTPDDCLLYFHKHIPDAWEMAPGQNFTTINMCYSCNSKTGQCV